MKRPTIPVSAVLALLIFSVSCGGSTSASVSASGSAEIHSGGESPNAGPASGSSDSSHGATQPSASTGSGGSAGASGSATNGGGGSRPPETGARYVIVVEAPQSLVPRLDRGTLTPAHDRLRTVVGGVDGVAVSNESRTAIASRLRAGGSIGLIVRCSILRVDVGPQGTRAAVSMVVARLENESVLGSLSGGALAPGSTGPDADRDAVAGAIESATRGLPQLLESL